MFSRYGYPASLLTDNGPQFVSDEFTTFLAENGIEHLRSAVYNPQTNGKVEVFNRFIKHGVQTFSDNQPWEESIHELLGHFRATRPAPDQKSPSELFFGRDNRLPFQVVRRPIHAGSGTLAKPTEQSFNRPSQFLHCRGPFVKGDQVLTKRPQPRKGQSPYTAPMTVEKVLSHYTYQLSDGQVWNARKMRRFYPPLPEPTTSPEDVPAPPVAPQPPRRSGRVRKMPDRFQAGADSENQAGEGENDMSHARP
jgi:hypothetical protein